MMRYFVCMMGIYGVRPSISKRGTSRTYTLRRQAAAVR
jgi:hypothetical protein